MTDVEPEAVDIIWWIFQLIGGIDRNRFYDHQVKNDEEIGIKTEEL